MRRHILEFFSTKITSTTKASASCCSSKDARASNGGLFEEFILLLSSVFLKKCQTTIKPYLFWSLSRRNFVQGCYFLRIDLELPS